MIRLLLLLPVLLFSNMELENVGCVKGFSVYKDMHCISEEDEFVRNADDTLSCKDVNKSIRSYSKEGSDKMYIDCNASNKDKCMPFYKKIDDTCVKIDDNIIKIDNEFICENRALRYTTFDIIDANTTLPHLLCIEKPRLLEIMFLNNNTDRFIMTIPLLGKGLLGVSKDLGVRDVRLLGKGEIVTFSNKEHGLLLLSDIVDVDDVGDYINIINVLEGTVREAIRVKLLIGLEPNMYKDPISMAKLIVDNNPRMRDLPQSSVKTVNITIFNIMTILSSTLGGVDGKANELVINYILEEYYHILSILKRDSLKLD